MAFGQTIHVSKKYGSSGDGSAGDPYETLQEALDNVTDAAGGVDIRLGSQEAQVLAASLTWNTGYALVNSARKPLRIIGQDDGAASLSWGDWAMATIDGNGAVAQLFSTTDDPAYVMFAYIRGTNCTGSVIDNRSSWYFHRCKIDINGSDYSLRLRNDSIVSGCYTDTAYLGYRDISVSTFFDSTGIGLTGAGNAVVLNNIVASTGTTGKIVTFKVDVVTVRGNTVVGPDSGTVIGIEGGANAEWSVIYDNIITKAGGYAIDIVSGGNALMLGPNVYFDNNDGAGNGVDNKVVVGLDLTGDDITIDPAFADEGAEDYTPTEATVLGTAWPPLLPPLLSGAGTQTTNVLDFGAVQAEAIGGIPLQLLFNNQLLGVN